MSTGTLIVRNALSHLGAHSPLQPASAEALETGRLRLNSMLANWFDVWGVDMGAVPLETVGSELSEPMGATNGIEYNLAIKLMPDFPGGQITQGLIKLARDEFSDIRAVWGDDEIPKVRVRGTLPKGQGNLRGGHRWDAAFFDEGDEIG